MKVYYYTIILLTLFAAGCATGYKETLEEYNKAEPLPYYERTLELADRSAEEEPAAREEALPSLEEMRENISPRDTFHEIASEFFVLSTEELRASFGALETTEQLDKELGGQLELDELSFALALHNPSVRAARHRWQATLRQYSQAEFLETLITEYRTFTRYLDVGAGKPMNKSMQQQQFPFPSTISLKGELVREQVRLAEVEWQKTLRDVVLETGNDFFTYQYIARAITSTEENVRLIENLLDVVERRYRTGGASQPDLLKVQTELERQRNMLEDLQSRRHAVRARINAALNRPEDAALGKPSEVDLPSVAEDVETLVPQALAQRQEVRMQETRVARIATAIRLGEVMNRPLFSQGYSTFERGASPEASAGESAASFGLMRKTRDRPDYARSEAYLAEMRERLAAAKAKLENIRARTRGLARTLIEEASVARREVDLIAEIVLPQSRSAYETTMSGYTAGDMSFLDLLDAERALISARLEQHQARRDRNQALLDITTARGTLPIAK